MNYKAPDNSLHFLDDDSFAYLLPEGSVAITDDEAESIRIANTPVPDPTIAAKAEAQAYLNSTDWYVVRFAETGVAIPQEVTDKRAEARELL